MKKILSYATLALIGLGFHMPQLDEYLAAEDTSTASVKGTASFIDNYNGNERPEVIPPDIPGGEPENPNHPDGGPGRPDNPGGNGGNGSADFHIAWASNLDFGDIEIDRFSHEGTAKPVMMYLQGDKKYAPFVQIANLKSNPQGWKLTVSGTPFKDHNKNAELKGSSINFQNITTIRSNVLPDGKPPKVSDHRLLSMDSNMLVLAEALSDEGQGVWTFSFTDLNSGLYESGKGVKLLIPANAFPKAGYHYTSDITWTLASTP